MHTVRLSVSVPCLSLSLAFGRSVVLFATVAMVVAAVGCSLSFGQVRSCADTISHDESLRCLRICTRANVSVVRCVRVCGPRE